MAHNKLLQQLRPLRLFLYLLLFSLVGIFLGQALGMVLAGFFYGPGFSALIEHVQEPTQHPGIRPYVLFIQGVTALVGFYAVPAFFARIGQWGPLVEYKSSPFKVGGALLVLAIIFTEFMWIGLVSDWNQSWQLPSGLEESLRGMEEKAQETTDFLTADHSWGMFFYALVIVALIPGFAEEYLFRRLLQPLLQKATNNPHWGIWITAAIFSAIHLQFYGFVPRLLLGAVLGYTFWLSGNWRLAALAHFLHNGLTLLFIHLENIEVIDFTLADFAGGTVGALVYFVLTGVLLYTLWRTYKKHPEAAAAPYIPPEVNHVAQTPEATTTKSADAPPHANGADQPANTATENPPNNPA